MAGLTRALTDRERQAAEVELANRRDQVTRLQSALAAEQGRVTVLEQVLELDS